MTASFTTRPPSRAEQFDNTQRTQNADLSKAQDDAKSRLLTSVGRKVSTHFKRSTNEYGCVNLTSLYFVK